MNRIPKLIFAASTGFVLIVTKLYWSLINGPSTPSEKDLSLIYSLELVGLVLMSITMFLAFTGEGRRILAEKSLYVFDKRSIASFVQLFLGSGVISIVLLLIVNSILDAMESNMVLAFYDPLIFSVSFYFFLIISYPFLYKIFHNRSNKNKK